jgi:hypothetical protein
MKIIYEDKLVKELRQLCDNVKKRIWIASPFIGNWESVRRILGKKWLDDDNVEVKLLTDITNNGKNINKKTFDFIRNKGEVKSIKGLHAKIYIIDDLAIITSANLTGTAFSKRYEVGILLSKNESKTTIDLYNNWWNNVAEIVPSDWVNKIIQGKDKFEGEPLFETLEELWKLPKDPGEVSKPVIYFRDYNKFLRYYKEFANIYKKIQRLNKNSYLYFETDAFLDYLYHHATNTPSKNYDKKKPRKLNEAQRKKEIKKYALKFKVWFNKNKDNFREKASKKIKKLLRKDKIEKLTKNEVEEIISQFNCMNSYVINKVKFLNNNNLEVIRKAWKNLIYGEGPLEIRMSKCKSSLKYFGKSSIQEFIAYYEPDKYPLRNTNSNSGLRFFGYDISAY